MKHLTHFSASFLYPFFLLLHLELNELLVDSSINKKAFMSQSDNNALRAVSIVESTEQLQKDPAKTMATGKKPSYVSQLYYTLILYYIGV